MEISRKIYLLRTENNLTQAEFAKIAGATDKAVSAWENGIRSPKLQYTKPICDYFGIDFNTFVDESNDIYRPDTCQETKSKPVESELDELDKELIQRLTTLSPSELEKVDAFVQGLLASR